MKMTIFLLLAGTIFLLGCSTNYIIINKNLNSTTNQNIIPIALYLTNNSGSNVIDENGLYNGSVIGAAYDNVGCWDGQGAYKFSGDASYLEMPDYPFSTEATISFWIKTEENIPSIEESTGLMSMTAEGNVLHYPYTDGVMYINTFRDDRLDISGGFDRSKWHMLTIVTRPGVDGWVMYQNDTQIYNTTGESQVYTTPGDNKIGTSVIPYSLNGTICKITIYKDSLTSDDITQLYNGITNFNRTTNTTPTDWNITNTNITVGKITINTSITNTALAFDAFVSVWPFQYGNTATGLLFNLTSGAFEWRVFGGLKGSLDGASGTWTSSYLIGLLDWSNLTNVPQYWDWSNITNIPINLSDTGNLNILGNYSSKGIVGVTASGTACAITAITGGIITGATCT